MGTEAENLARAQSHYATFRTGDVAGGVHLFAEDVVYIQPGEGGLSGTLHGRDAVQRHIETVKTRNLKNQPQQWFAAGPRVLLLTRIGVEGEEFTAVDVMTFEGDEVAHFESVTDTAVMDRIYPRESGDPHEPRETRADATEQQPLVGTLDHVAFNVRDLDASVDWYQRMLGAQVVSEVQRHAAPFSIVTVEVAGIRIDLGSRPDMQESALAGATPAEVTRSTGITHLAVLVDDLAHAHELLEARGVRFVGAPKFDEVSGCRYAWLVDLDGNHVELLERRP